MWRNQIKQEIAWSLFWDNPALFFVYFQSFQANNTIFTTNLCEKMPKCPSSIRCRHSNPRPFEHELSPITTRLRLPIEWSLDWKYHLWFLPRLVAGSKAIGSSECLMVFNENSDQRELGRNWIWNLLEDSTGETTAVHVKFDSDSVHLLTSFHKNSEILYIIDLKYGTSGPCENANTPVTVLLTFKQLVELIGT